MDSLNVINILYLVGALLIFFSIMASTVSARLGMPLLLCFLGVGILAGEQGVLGIHFAEYGFANFIGQAALACILLDGGLRTSFQSFRVGLRPAITLATWGVFATVLVLGLFVTWLMDLDWRLGLLMAAIVGSTDAAAVFSLLRNGGVKLNERVQAALELESGANDPLAILLVTGLIALNVDPNGLNMAGFMLLLLQQIGVGLIMGIAGGYLLSRLLPKLALAEGMYAILIMSAGLGVFAATNLLGGCGFLAVYLTGILIGNYKVRATEHVLRVMDSFAWLSQAVLFVVLGMLVTPSNVLNVWYYSLAITAFMIFVARPLAVFTSLKPFKFKNREIGFISWVGLRGAVPITLAILPIMAQVEDAFLLFDITFGVVVLSLLVQGMSIPFMASRFNVRLPTNDDPEAHLEIWVSDKERINLYKFVVKSGAFAVGRHPTSITNRLSSDDIQLFALVRGSRFLPVHADTVLKPKDEVWYALHGDYAKKIATICNDSNINLQSHDDFYGDWLVSPHAKLVDLPFLKSLLDQDCPKSTLPKHINNQTVAEYMLFELETKPVVGDTIDLGSEWALIIHQMNDDGSIRSIGLKHLQSKDVD